jgi:YD repeat-containing protein
MTYHKQTVARLDQGNPAMPDCRNDIGRRTVQRNPNGSRDAASQTTQVIQRSSAGTTLQQLDYRYDNAGNRNVMIEGAGTARVTWSYDKQNQLTGEYRTGTNAYRQTFAYDPAGNRTLKNADGARTTCAYDAANQLRYAQALAGRTTYAFDLDG